MCRLQTFPDGLEFSCSRHELQRLVGNAVPSLLTEILAWEIRQQLLGVSGKVRALKLLPVKREPVPKPERIAPVPREYSQYLGDHAAHPGEGLGRGALRRMGALKNATS